MAAPGRATRVLCRRGLRRGAASRPFHPADLVEASYTNPAEPVYLDLDSEGWVVAAGGGGSGRSRGEAAWAVSCAPLAAHVAVGGEALLEVVSGATGAMGATGAPRLRLRIGRDLPPHQEVAIWFDEELLALLEMPFLTLRNIRGRADYPCHRCGARFESPNPLKVHLFLACAPYGASAFWRAVLARLTAAAPPTPVAPLAPPLGPAELEALATEWGRARGGHVCVYCGKAYSRKYGLKIHIRTHTGYRPLRCRHCLRAFGDPSNLNKHVRLHAARDPRDPHEPRPRKGGARACALCGKVVARQRDLERHRRTHLAR